MPLLAPKRNSTCQWNYSINIWFFEYVLWKCKHLWALNDISSINSNKRLRIWELFYLGKYWLNNSIIVLRANIWSSIRCYFDAKSVKHLRYKHLIRPDRTSGPKQTKLCPWFRKLAGYRWSSLLFAAMFVFILKWCHVGVEATRYRVWHVLHQILTD